MVNTILYRPFMALCTPLLTVVSAVKFNGTRYASLNIFVPSDHVTLTFDL